MGWQFGLYEASITCGLNTTCVGKAKYTALPKIIPQKLAVTLIHSPIFLPRASHLGHGRRQDTRPDLAMTLRGLFLCFYTDAKISC